MTQSDVDNLVKFMQTGGALAATFAGGPAAGIVVADLVAFGQIIGQLATGEQPSDADLRHDDAERLLSKARMDAAAAAALQS